MATIVCNREELHEHRLNVHLLTCRICGEMSNTRDEVKSRFFSHLVYITNGGRELDEHTQAVQLLTCGNCREMSNGAFAGGWKVFHQSA